MGNAGFGACEQIDLGLVQFDTMGMPDIVPCPSQIFCVLTRPTAELSLRIGDIFVIFGQVRVQHHTFIPGQQGRIAHEVPADRKG